MSNTTKHSLYLIITYLITSGLNYIFGVGLSWFFTPSKFGVLGVTQSLLLLLALFVGSGFAWTAAQDIARDGINDESRLRFRTAWLANMTVGVVIGLGIWFAYQYNFLPLGPAYQTIIPLVSLATILFAVRAVTNGVIRGVYRFGALSINLILEVVIKITVGISLVTLGWGVEGVMLGFVLGAGISLIHSNLVVRQVKLWQGEGWFHQNVIPATIPLFVGMLGTALMINLDVLGLKLFANGVQGDELSGFYQAAVILARMPVFLSQALTLVLFSYAAGAVLENQVAKGWFMGYFQAALRSWFRFLVPIGLVLIIAPGDVLYLMFPAQYQASSKILQLAAVGGILLSLVTLLNGVLQATGHKRGVALSTSVATICQIIIIIWIIPRYRAYGAAISLVVAGTIALIGIVAVYIRMPSFEGLTALNKELFVKMVREIIPLMIMGFLLIINPSSSRLLILLKLTLAGIIYLLTLYMIQTNRRERPKEGLSPLMSLLQLVIGV